MVCVFVVSKGAASKRKGYWSMLTIHSTKRLSSWQHKTNEASDSPCWLTYSHQQHRHMKDSSGGGRGLEHTSWNRPHKPRGFLLITNVHPLHSALSQSGSHEVLRINVKIQDRTQCFSPVSFSILNRNPNFTKRRSGSDGWKQHDELTATD